MLGIDTRVISSNVNVGTLRTCHKQLESSFRCYLLFHDAEPQLI